MTDTRHFRAPWQPVDYRPDEVARLKLADSFGQTQVGAVPVQVLTQDLQRDGYAIENQGAATVYVGATDGVSASEGMPLPQWHAFNARGQDAVWCVCPTGTVTVAWSAEVEV